MSSLDLLREMVSEELEAVTFVRGYLQFQFSGSLHMNAYNPVTVTIGGTATRQRSSGFADALVSVLDRRVVDVQLETSVRLLLVFEGEAIVEVSLRDDDYVGAEAYYFDGRKAWSVG